MNIWFSLLISLLLTTFVSFTTPMIIFGLILSGLAIISHLPEVAMFGQACYTQVWSFLIVFGNGSVSQGFLTIGLTCGVVGFLFESLNFYRYQTLIAQPIINNQIQSR